MGLKHWMLAAGAALAVCAAQATTVTVSYDATVTNVYSYDYNTGMSTALPSYYFPAGQVSLGDTISGHYSYNPATFYDSGCCDGPDMYRVYFSDILHGFGADSTNGLHLSTADWSYGYTGMVVDDGTPNSPFDAFTFQVGTNDSNANIWANVIFTDGSSNLVSGEAVPSSLNVSGATVAYMGYGMTINDYLGFVQFDAEVSNVRVTVEGAPQTVPEPSSPAIFVAGALGLLALRRRAKARHH